MTYISSVLSAGLLIGCWGTGVTDTTVVKTLPPYAGTPEVRMSPQASKGQLVAIMKVDAGAHGEMCSGSTPDQEMLSDIQKRAAQLGGNVIVLECAPPGTVGCGWCTANVLRE